MSDRTKFHDPRAASFGGQAGPIDQIEQMIGALQAENEALRARLADDAPARELREMLTLTAHTATMVSPASGCTLLRTILQTASYFLGAQAASLYLLDQENQDLVVATALGPKSAQVELIRVPIGHGIAGLVAATGEPMAISDVASDPRHAANISQFLGHVPESILCVPLLYEDRVIGVLELFDKEGAPAFSGTDIEALTLFADLAAVAIEQSCRLKELSALAADVLGVLGPTPAGAELRTSVQAFAQRIEEQPSYQRARDLALLIQEIGSYGDQELETCHALVSGFATYLRARKQPLDGVR